MFEFVLELFYLFILFVDYSFIVIIMSRDITENICDIFINIFYE